MLKSFFFDNIFNLNYPLILNILILMLISIPIKFNNFHPLKIIIILILLTFLIFLKINFIIKSWINFFLLLIIIGGLIVIFIYITRLNNNTLFKFNLLNIKKNLFKFLILIFFFLLIFKINLIFNNNQDLFNYNLNFNEEKNNISIIKLFNINKIPIIFIIIYLYFSLICIINICYKIKTPLRQINY